ncbi:hypothetical protein BDQ12DRAFT_448040 [Crucibulum laeve]|uniref:Uncharacterized protein n=1 Tax=Crucibulum laeve TaxID=68775 RepID=A0A5C3LJ75_9AGAR|nr:hypothetical protein BDQ12DRAFT_448040 [Crucibulum laeve]
MIWMPNLLTTRRPIMAVSSENVEEASRPDHVLRNILFAIDRNVNAAKRPVESCQKLLNESTEAVHTVSEILNILRTDAIVPASIYFSSTIGTLERHVNQLLEHVITN